jgi:hypothetical protein
VLVMFVPQEPEQLVLGVLIEQVQVLVLMLVEQVHRTAKSPVLVVVEQVWVPQEPRCLWPLLL